MLMVLVSLEVSPIWSWCIQYTFLTGHYACLEVLLHKANSVGTRFSSQGSIGRRGLFCDNPHWYTTPGVTSHRRPG